MSPLSKVEMSPFLSGKAISVSEGKLLTSERERERHRLIKLIADGRMRQRDAALRLEISVRQVKRLLRAWRVSGAAGLVSKRRGQPSNNRHAPEFKALVLSRIKAPMTFYQRI